MNTITAESAASGPVTGPSAPGDLVTAAIAQADYANLGALFAPFLVKFADPGDFVNGWTAEKGNPISFYGSYKKSSEFLPLGDFATVNNTPVQETPILLLAPSPDYKMAPAHGDVQSSPTLAHPTGFTWIGDDKHSGNTNSIAYYWPTAPDGYQALGICVGFNGATPDVTKYWCVNNYYLQSAPVAAFWSDAGSHWTSHDGSLSTPTLAGVDVQDQKIQLAPTTLLSNQHGDLQNTSWCLSLEKLMLPVTGEDIPGPDYQPSYREGATTAPGLGNVAVLPSTLVEDRSPGVSPFYYLAAQPQWVCTRSFPSPEGTLYSSSFTLGSTQESSSGFQHTTSLTVGADAGIEAGPVSAKISVSYTDEMQLSTSTVAGTATQATEGLSIPVSKADRTLVWQNRTEFVLYRTAGDVMSSVAYQTRDLAFSDSNPT